MNQADTIPPELMKLLNDGRPDIFNPSPKQEITDAAVFWALDCLLDTWPESARTLVVREVGPDADEMLSELERRGYIGTYVPPLFENGSGIVTRPELPDDMAELVDSHYTCKPRKARRNT